MGLAERRGAKEFETSQYPALKDAIVAAAKFELPIEVKWDTLAVDSYAHLYSSCWPKVYFQPLIEALQSITRDEMGSEALKGGLKKIVIQNVGGYSSGVSYAKWEGGTLILDHTPVTNVDDIKERTDSVVKLLESKL